MADGTERPPTYIIGRDAPEPTTDVSQKPHQTSTAEVAIVPRKAIDPKELDLASMGGIVIIKGCLAFQSMGLKNRSRTKEDRYMAPGRQG